MQNLTPMKRYKDILKVFEDKLSNNFNIVKLNKASSKYNPTARYDEKSRTKGVESDFIIIFKNKAKGKYFTVDSGESSFAFTFNYIDLKEEDFSVEVSLKVNKFIKSTKKIPVKDFISVLKKIIKEDNELLNNPFEIINQNFLKSEFSIEKELNSVFKDVLELKEKHQEENKLLIEKSEKLKKELSKALKKADKELTSSLEAKELLEIEKKYLIAKNNYENKQASILIENNITTLEKEYLKITNSIKNKLKSDEDLEKKIIEKLPKKAQKTIKVKL